MTAYLIVKSDTSLVNQEEFDDWYQVEHLNEANKVLMSLNAKRAWIKGTKLHLAIYKFKNKKDAEKAISSEGLKMLIQKFDDKWNYKVKRTRELLELSQEI
jgi:hypothetical protein|tara:strand:- start:651 stop:953 length:303 start_codon:yes stop_codon:yes gene_type:complete